MLEKQGGSFSIRGGYGVNGTTVSRGLSESRSSKLANWLAVIRRRISRVWRASSKRWV